jgi:hypothetical protein
MSFVEPRFELDKLVQFRQPGAAWQLGRTRNLSRSGLLFSCEEALEVGATIELCLLDQDVRGRSFSGQLCLAQVVRLAAPPFPEAGLLIGIRFAQA